MYDTKTNEPAKFSTEHYAVYKARYGYQVHHVGTGLLLPHLGHHLAPAGLPPRVSIRYLKDAKAFAREAEAFEGMASEGKPSTEALRAFGEYLKQHPADHEKG